MKKIHSRKTSQEGSTELQAHKQKGEPELEPAYSSQESNKEKKKRKIHSRKTSKQDPTELQTQIEKGSAVELNAALEGVIKHKTFKRLAWEIMMMQRICKFFFSGLQEVGDYEISEAITRSEKERMETLEKEKESRVIKFGLIAKTSQDRMSHRAVQITMKKPEWRTQEELKLLRILLEELPSFRQYSRNLQLMLARVVRFQRFGRRRVVIKMGHIGNSFYFIYSGSVAITKDKDGSSAFIDKDPTILRKGDAFGEVALLNDSRRNATVVCMEDTELLAVHKDDFFANKLDVEQAEELKYRYDFFRSLELFASWSDKLIETLAASCKTNKYRHGQVIISDSSETNKLAFVSKGCCQLLRQVHLIDCPKYQKWIHQHARQYSNLQRAFVKPSPKHSGRKQYRSIKLGGHHLLEPVYHRSSLHNLSRRLRAQQAERENLDFPIEKKHSEDKLHEIGRKESNRAPKFRPSMMVSTQFGRVHKGFAAAVYMRIDQLREGECLGFHQYLVPHRFQDERGLVLVSNGAEIIKLKRDRFDEFLDDATRKCISRYERTYPSDDKLCQIFLQQNRWKIFKGDLAEMLVKHQTGIPKRDFQIEAHSFIRYSIILNQAGMLDPSDILARPPDSSQPQIPMFFSASEDKKRAGSPPKADTRLIHGITIPHTEMELLLH